MGPGDDSAVIAVGDERLMLTADTILEGTHFRKGTNPGLVGAKAVNVSLSDLAAMAALPTAVLVAAALPRDFRAGDARSIMEGAFAAANAFGADVAGGDVTSWEGPLAVTTTALGVSRGVGPILRSGARVGDAVFVTGSLGGSRLGRHLRFRPRMREARGLACAVTVTSMIDLSDGLATDLAHLCEESGVGAEIEARRVPVSPSARRLSATTGRTPLWHALNDGEDFELLFTVAAAEASRVPKRLVATAVTGLGTIKRGRTVRLIEVGGRRRVLRAEGYEHRFSA